MSGFDNAGLPYPEKVDAQTLTTAAFAIAAPKTAGTIKKYTMTGTPASVTGPPAVAGLSFDIWWLMGGAGSYTFPWPAAFRWFGASSAGTAPSFPTAAGSVFVTSHVCVDGTYWESAYIGESV